MQEDKNIPSKPYQPGSTTIKDKDGADIVLGQNKISIGTLGDVSSILLTTPVNVNFPSTNFTTVEAPTVVVSEIVLPTPQPFVPLPTVINIEQEPAQVIIKAEKINQTTTQQVSSLPDEEDFALLFDDFTGISTTNNYVGVSASFIETEVMGTYSGNQTSGHGATWSTLDSTKQNTAKQLYKTFTKDFGMTELEAKVLLGVIAKESLFMVKNPENLRYTSPDRFRTTFGKYTRVVQTGSRKGKAFKIREWTDDELKWMLGKEVRIGNFIYGLAGTGNIASTSWDDPNQDGYKFRGRTYNGLTFRGSYQKYQDIYNKKNPGKTVDIIKNPDLLNSPPLAFEFTGLYFINSKNVWPPSKAGYNLKNPKDAVYYFIRVNAGWGNFNGKYSSSNGVIMEGASKAQAFYESIKDIKLD